MNKSGELLASVGQRIAGAKPVLMEGRSASKRVRKVRLHRLKHFRQDRSRSLMIEIDLARRHFLQRRVMPIAMDVAATLGESYSDDAEVATS